MHRLVSRTVVVTALACGACVIHIPKQVDLAVQVADRRAAGEEPGGPAPGFCFAVEAPRAGPARLRVRWRAKGAVTVIDGCGRGHRIEPPGPGRWHLLEFDPAAADGVLTLWAGVRPDGSDARRRLRIPGRVCPVARNERDGVALGVVPAPAPSGRTTLRLCAGGRCLEVDLAPARTAVARRRPATSAAGGRRV